MSWPKIVLSDTLEVWLPGGDEVDSTLYFNTFLNVEEHHYIRSELILSPDEKHKLLEILIEDRDKHTPKVA